MIRFVAPLSPSWSGRSGDKPGRSWFDSRGWDAWIAGPSLAGHGVSATPVACKATTKQACRGDRPVRHTDLRPVRLRSPAPHVRSSKTRTSPDRTHLLVDGTRHPTLLASPDACHRRVVGTRRRQGARSATRTNPGSLFPHPGPSCPRTIRCFPPPRGRREPTHQRVRSTSSSSRRSWWSCVRRLRARVGPDVRRVKARPHDRCRPDRRHGIEAHLVERPVVNRSVLVRIQPIPPQ